MSTPAANGYNSGYYPVKPNTAKQTGAKLGALAGTVYIAHETKPLREYIGKHLDKIQIKHPNIKGNYADIFKSYLKTAKTGANAGKKGLYVCKNSTEIAKRSGLLGAVVVAGAMAGLAIGSVIDNVKHAKAKKAALNTEV